MELVGTFTTIDFLIGFSSTCDVFDTSVKVFSESTNSFSFPQSSKIPLAIPQRMVLVPWLGLVTRSCPSSPKIRHESPRRPKSKMLERLNFEAALATKARFLNPGFKV